jgi:hypothetical protein
MNVVTFVFFFLTIFLFLAPYISFEKQPFYIPVILGTLSFIFGYVLYRASGTLFQQKNMIKIERDIAEAKHDIAKAEHGIAKEENEKKKFKSNLHSEEITKSSGKQKIAGQGQQVKNKGQNPSQYEFEKKYYPTLTKLLENEVTFNWQRLSCFLITNSIILATWAIILAEMANPPRILLIGIALSGLFFSFFWRSAAIRGNRFHFFWLEKLRKFEDCNIPEKYRIFIRFKEFTTKGLVRIWKKDIKLEWLAKVGVGEFFILLAYIFLVIYLLITVYSIFIPSLPFFFPN